MFHRSFYFLASIIFNSACIETKVSVNTNVVGSIQKDQSLLDQSLDQQLSMFNDQEINQSSDQEIDLEVSRDLSVLERCALNVERCNFIDDDCDQKVDEGDQVCGQLIAQHCELTVGWTDYPINGVENIDHWPRLSTDPSSMGCPQDQPSQLINNYLETTCGKTGKDQQFHPITFFGVVDHTDRLGVHFQCDQQDPLSQDEKDLLYWVDQHCSVAIGYKPNPTDVFPSFSDCTSGVSSANGGAERCVKSRNDMPRTFAILDLETSVDAGDSFAVMFACDDPNDIDKVEKIEKSIEVFMGFYLIRHPMNVDLNIGCAPHYFDPIFPYLQCPQQTSAQAEEDDLSAGMLCFGSQQSKNWGKSVLGHNKLFVGHCDQMLIGLFPARQR
jgi:hypothetical protein